RLAIGKRFAMAVAQFGKLPYRRLAIGKRSAILTPIQSVERRGQPIPRRLPTGETVPQSGTSRRYTPSAVAQFGKLPYRRLAIGNPPQSLRRSNLEGGAVKPSPAGYQPAIQPNTI